MLNGMLGRYYNKNNKRKSKLLAEAKNNNRLRRTALLYDPTREY